MRTNGEEKEGSLCCFFESLVRLLKILDSFKLQKLIELEVKLIGTIPIDSCLSIVESMSYHTDQSRVKAQLKCNI